VIPRSYNRLGHRSTAKPQLERAHDIVQQITSKPAEPAISAGAMARIQAAVEERKRQIKASI
jgi:hypothetical protein